MGIAVQTLLATPARVALAEAWTQAEIREAVGGLLASVAHRLPAERGARILVKPNLNNDLPALVGNSVDLRVLSALLEELSDRGYGDVTVADGSNVGVERRGIDSFRRLRVDRLAARMGVRVLDLNHAEGLPVALQAGAAPLVSRAVLESDLFITVPKVKTHVEAGLSSAMKNQVGICRGQDKRQMHLDLGRNILALWRRRPPDLVLVDGLIGMEGNGPGDGDPFRFGRLLAADDALWSDVVVARLVGLPRELIPALVHAAEAGLLAADALAEVDRLPVLRPIRPAPPLSKLARLANDRRIFWLKKLARPITDRPKVLRAAYRAGVIQDVYERDDDAISGLVRAPASCGDCRRCESFCPAALPLEQIGLKPAAEACLECLYCWWVCPRDAITLEGAPGQLAPQALRYREAIERVCR